VEPITVSCPEAQKKNAQPIHAVVKGRTQMFPVITKLTGVTIGDGQKNINEFSKGKMGACDLIRELQNPHDPNAIRVETNGHYLGYIPKGLAEKITPLMDNGTQLRAEIVQPNKRPYYPVVGLTVKIRRVGGKQSWRVCLRAHLGHARQSRIGPWASSN
jgi:hypothetical protein